MKPTEITTDTILQEHRASGPQSMPQAQSAAPVRTVQRADAIQLHATTPNETEQVIRTFLERVQEITGILGVRAHGGNDLADQSFVIEVDDLRSPAANNVYNLRRDLLRKHRNARLDVRVSAVRHECAAPASVLTIER